MTARGPWRRKSLIAAACVPLAVFSAGCGTSQARQSNPQSDPPSLCATKPAATSGKSAGSVTSGRNVWSFKSAPSLHPMKVTVNTRRAGTAPGQILVAPFSASKMVGQTGSLITDNSGHPIWFRPLSSANLQNADFTVQTYHNAQAGTSQPVLTWWQGTLALPPTYTNLPAGAPEPGGCYYIYDTHYRLIRTVSARNGFGADEHEFTLTPQGDALFVASKKVSMDLRPYGGPKQGAVEDSEVQEINLATGKLVFSWDIMKHVSLADSKVKASSASSSGGVWDAFHMNSVDQGPNGQLLVSARNMWAIYDVSKKTGKILWQLGGQKSDFTFASNARFYWQHDARFRPGNGISMFDDGCCNLPKGKPEQQSHGLILSLDFRTHNATAVATFYHKPALHSPTQGNLQVLPNGNVFIGWGQSPYYSEYNAAGNSAGNGAKNLLYDAKIPGSNISYRAFRQVWTGTPYYPPALAVRSSGGRRTVYASWNGSTQTTAWQVLAGPSAGSLSVVAGRVTRSGFETAITTNNRGPYFQVKALNAAGKVLRASQVVQVHP
jgi:hypothetical protein